MSLDFLFPKEKMLAMERRMVNLVLVTSILMCAMRGNAKVPRPYEEVVNYSNKYGKELEKRMVDARDSGNSNHTEYHVGGGGIYEVYT